MADAKPIQEANDAYINIVASLKEIIRLQDKEIAKAKQLNIEGELRNVLQKTHLTTEETLASLQTSVTTKLKTIVQLEGARRDYLRAGYASTSAEILAITDYLRVMRRETKEAVKQHDILLQKMVLMGAALNIANKVGFEGMLKFTKELGESWSTHPILGISKVFSHVLDIFDGIDKSAAKFRQDMGFTRDVTSSIDDNVREISFDFAHVGVNAEKSYESTLGLSKALFSSLSATKSLVSDISLISAQLGISEELSSEFVKNFGLISRSTAQAQSNMVFFTAKMTEAAGVPLKEIMSDINKSTQSSYQFISRSGLSLIKASIEAKRMGTSLADTVKTSDRLLQFTQNVKDEMEASVLVGKSINLQRVRELAYNRDISGLNKEILKIMKDVNFEQLDPFQQASVATAFGKSAGELANMAQAERQRLEWERSTDPIVKSQLKSYKEMMNATESIANEQGKNARHQLTVKANQAAIASITQSWNAILQRIGQVWLPIIDSTLKGIAYVVGGINRFIMLVNSSAEQVNSTLGFISKGFFSILTVVGLLVGSRYLGRLAGWATGSIGKGIGNMLGGIAGGVSRFGSSGVLRGILGIAALGLSLIPFIFAMKMMTGLNWKSLGVAAAALVAFTAAAFGLGALLDTGVGAVLFVSGAAGIAALGIALIPFSYAAQKAGKAMIDLGNGFKSVVDGMVLLQSLTFTNTIIQLYKLTSAIIDVSNAINGMPDIKIEKLKSLAIPDSYVPVGEKRGQSTEDILGSIKDSIDGLRNDMKNGSLTANVFIDSQKLDSLMGRRLAYTGTLT